MGLSNKLLQEPGGPGIFPETDLSLNIAGNAFFFPNKAYDISWNKCLWFFASVLKIRVRTFGDAQALSKESPPCLTSA